MESLNKIIDHPVKKTKPEEKHIPPPSKPKISPAKRLYRELSNLTCTFKESLLPATLGRRRCSTSWFNPTKRTQQKSEDIVNVENVKLTAAPIRKRRQTTLTKEAEQKSEDHVNGDNVKLTAAPIHRRRKTCSALQPIKLTIGLSIDGKEYCVRSNESAEAESSNGTDDLNTNKCLPNHEDFFNRELKVALKRIPDSSCKTLNSPTIKTKSKEMPHLISFDSKPLEAPISSLLNNSNKSPQKYTTFFNVDKNMTFKSTKTCALCNKKSHDLTNHYVSQHNSESYISRLSSAEISELEANENFAIPCRKNRYKITCAFCKEELQDSFENLPAHFSYHTGEYNFQCGGCKIVKPYKADVGSHQQRTRMCRNSKIRTLNHYESDLAIIYLYVCKLCNFGNLHEVNVGKHLRKEHGIKTTEEEHIKKCILAAKDLRQNSDITVQSHSDETSLSLSPERLMEELHAQNNTETKLTIVSSLDDSPCKSPEKILDEFHASIIDSKKSISSSNQVLCQSPEKRLEKLYSQNNTEIKITAFNSLDESTCKSPERLLEELHASDSLGANVTEISSSNEALNQNTEMLLEDLENSQTLSNIMTVTQSSTKATNSNPELFLEVFHDSDSVTTTIASKSTNKSTPVSIKRTTEIPCQSPEILLEELHAPTSSNKAMSDNINISNDVLTQHPGKLLEERHDPEPLGGRTNIHNSGTTQVVRKKLNRSLIESKIEPQSKHSMIYRQYNKADSNNFGLLKCIMEDCLFSTNSDDEFKMHLLNNHIDSNETKKFDCPYCVEESYSLEDFLCHIWRKHGQSKYQCGECSYRSRVPGNVIIHSRMWHNDIKTTKSIYKCYSREPNKIKYKAVSEKMKENIASLKCPDCPSSFYAMASIKSHIQKSHPLTFQTFSSLKLNEFACIHCKKESNCKEMMQIHMMLQHPDEPGLIIERKLRPEGCEDSLDDLVLVNISPNVFSDIEITAVGDRKSPDVMSSNEDKETPKKSENEVNQLKTVTNGHQQKEQEEQPVQTETLVLTHADFKRKLCRSPDISVLKHSSYAKESRSETTLIPESTRKSSAKVKQSSSAETKRSKATSSNNPRVPLKNQQPKVKEVKPVENSNKAEETSSNNAQVPLKNQQRKVKEGQPGKTNNSEETSSNNPRVPLKNQQLKVKAGSSAETNKSEEASSNNPQFPLKSPQPKVKEGQSLETSNKAEETSSNNALIPLKSQQPKEKEGSPEETNKSEETSSNAPRVSLKNQQPKEKEGSSAETNKSEETSSNDPRVSLKNQQPKVKEGQSLETSNKAEETSSNNAQIPLKSQQPKEKEGSPEETIKSEETSSNNTQLPLKNQQPKEKEGSPAENNKSVETSSNDPQVSLKIQQPKVKEGPPAGTNKSEGTSSHNPQVPLKNQQPKVKEGSSAETNKSEETSSNNPQVCLKIQQPKVKGETSSNNFQIPLTNQQPQKSPESSVKSNGSIVNPAICESQHSELSSALEIIVIDDDYDEDPITSEQLPIQPPKEPTELVQTTVIDQTPPTRLEKKEKDASEYWNAAVNEEGPRIGPLLELLVEHTGIHSSTLHRCPLCMASFIHFELWLTHMKNKHKITADVHCPYCNMELALDSAESHFQSHRRHEYICYYCIASFCSNEKLHEHFALCHENHSTIKNKIADLYVVMKQDAIITDYTALLQDFAEAIYRNLIEKIQRHTINEWLPGLTDSCFDEMEVPQYKQEGRPLFKCFVELCSFVGPDENSFDNHIVQHEVPETFKCSYCLFRLAKPSWESIKFHYLLHQSPSLHICCVCKFVHYNSEGMTKHIENLHNSRDVPIFCLSRNDSNYKLSLSIVLPPNQMTFTTSKACFCCLMEIRNSSKFISHLKKEHRLSFCPRCRICDKIILTQFEAENHCKDHQMEAFQLKYEVFTPYLYNLTVKSRSPLTIEMSLQKRSRDRQQCITNESTSVSIKEEVVVVKDELQVKTKTPSISLKCLNTDQLMANRSERESFTTTTTIMAPTVGNTSAPTAGQCFSPSTQPQQVLTNNEISFLTRGHSSPSTTIQNCLVSTVAQNSLSNNAFRYSFSQQTVTTEMSLPAVRAVQQSTSPTDTRHSSPFSQTQRSISMEAPLPNRSPSTVIRHTFPSTYVRQCSMVNTAIQYSSPDQAAPLLSPRAVQHSPNVQRSTPSTNSLRSSPSLQLQPLPNRRLSTNIGHSLPSTDIRYSMLATALRNSSPNQPVTQEVPIRSARSVQHSTPGIDARYPAPSPQPQEVTTAALMPNLIPIQNSTPSTNSRHSSQHNVISEIQLGTGRAVISIPPSAFQAPTAERPAIAQRRISVITSSTSRIDQRQLAVRTAGTASIPQLSNTSIQTHQSNAPNIDELVPFCGNCYLECSDFIHLKSHHEATHACNNERFYFYVDRKVACMHCHFRGAVESFLRHHAGFHPHQLQLCCSVKDANRCGICNEVFLFPASSANSIQAMPVCACPNRERVLADCLNLPTLRALQDIGSEYFKYSCDFCSGCFESFHQYSEHFARVHQKYVDPALSKTKSIYYCCVCSTIKSYKISDIVNHIRLSHVMESGLTFFQAYNEFYRKIRVFHPYGFTVFLGDLRNTGQFDEEGFKRELYLNEARFQNFWSSQTSIN